MHNKLIILSLAVFFGSALQAQDRSGRSVPQELKISIYPNPAFEYIVVELDKTVLGDVKFELNSMIGNKIEIRAEEIGYGKYEIPLKKLSTGYYFLVVKDESARKKSAFKFLKN